MKTVTTLYKTEKSEYRQPEENTQQDLIDTQTPDENGLVFVQRTARDRKSLPGDIVVIDPKLPKKQEINYHVRRKEKRKRRTRRLCLWLWL